MSTNLERKFKLNNRTTGDMNTMILGIKDFYEYEDKKYWQEDIFYSSKRNDNMRLKLRKQGDFDKKGQLISYKREDKKGARDSVFKITIVEDVEKFKEQVEGFLIVDKILRKHRWEYIKRIHFDKDYKKVISLIIHIDYIPDLGNFIEFEINYDPTDDQSKKIAFEKMNEFIKFFELENETEISCAYVDLK